MIGLPRRRGRAGPRVGPRGLLAVDHDRFNALTLTEVARPLLRAEAELHLRVPVKRKSSRKEPRFVGRDARDDALFASLREWRAETARERNVPAYVIFHDATLGEIAHARPQRLAELAEISGVGDRKLEAYGEQILGLVGASVAPG